MNSIKGRLAFALTAMALICALVMPGLASPALAYSSYPLQPADEEVANALDYLRSAQTGDGSIGGFGTSAWVTMAIAAAGEDPHDWGNPSIVDYLRENSELLADELNLVTGYERMILAITAAGENPYSFGEGDPTYAPNGDYVTKLKSYYDGNQFGDDELLNDDFWGVLALISAGEDPESDITQSTMTFIKANQGGDGGWTWAIGGESDVDDTSAAIMALVAAGETLSLEAITMGLEYLSMEQGDNGGFGMWGAVNSASTSWAIDAIVAAGEDPTSGDWTWDDNPVNYLLSLQDTDGGFKWKEDSSSNKEWMTADAIPALLGKPYPVAVYEAPPPTEPTIAFSPSSFSFTATEDGANPAGKTLEIWNSGIGTLNWSVSNNANWLSLSPRSGNSTGEDDEVTLLVDISGMSADDYDATITIRDPEATNSPQTVSVSLHIATGSSYYSLTTSVSPAEGGSISLDIAQPDEGYLEGSEVELTISPAAGYAFGCWTGNLSGSTNPATIAITSSKSLTANFVLFDAGDLTNVGLVRADSEVTSVSVDSYPIEDLSNIPSGLDVQLAYVVEPAGSGSFNLRFIDISNVSSVKIYKVVDGSWSEIEDATITGNVVELTLDVSDPIIALCFPTPPKPPPASQPPPSLAEQINWPILSGVIAGVIVIGLLIFFLARKRAY